MNLPGRAVAVIVLMNLAQLPVAMRQLLVVLLGHHNTGSFATAGAASAACGLGLAVSAPLYGRLLPRFGDRVVLLGSGLAHLAALSGLALSTRPTAFVALAAAAGLATPPALSSGRSLLPRLVPAPALTRAYAVNAVGQELLYVGGPLAVTLSLLLTGPAGAVFAFAAVGSLALVGNALVVPRRHGADAADRAARPAARRTVRTLLGVHLGYATCMGAMWVLVPAFAAGAGHPDQAGVLITVWSVGSLAGGLVLARRGRLADPRRAYLALLATMALTSAVLPWPRTVPQMAVALAVFGLALAPWLAVTDGLMARAAPAPHTAEAYGWLQTVGQLGTALGAASSGAVSDRFGTTGAFLIVPAALAVAVAVALTRRRALSAGPETAGPPAPEPDVSLPGGRVAG